MRFLKHATRGALAKLGYQVTRSTNAGVRFENFASLARAYEQQLIDRGEDIPPNALRPELLARLLGTSPSEAYFIVQALARCRLVPGDVCEFGVAQGETSALIANEIFASGDKRLHLFDSFEGLPPPSAKDQLKDDIFSLGSIEAYTGAMSCPEDMVRRRLQALAFPAQRYTIHKGFIDETLRVGSSLPTQVCFAYVDFDFYEPIRTALDFLHRVTSVGAVVIVDDYDYFSTGAKTAVDEFVAARNSGGVVYECLVPDTHYGHFAMLTKTG